MPTEIERLAKEVTDYLLDELHIGDYVYDVRERAGGDWHAPEVNAFQSMHDKLTEIRRLQKEAGE